jgi:hypothetical protein
MKPRRTFADPRVLESLDEMPQRQAERVAKRAAVQPFYQRNSALYRSGELPRNRAVLRNVTARVA